MQAEIYHFLKVQKYFMKYLFQLWQIKAYVTWNSSSDPW